MVVKTVSSRASIIGRGAKCRGKSAVEQSAYISRTTLYSEYYGEKFYPKAAEDLVSTGVMLPDHAPREYMDHSVLWNSVEKVEKHAKAQLCRLNKYSLPNWMSYELADKFVRDFINRNFVSKGMCAEYAIHDSVNEKGERNLHVHILLTMRPILENGEWGEKSRKVYKYDKDGNKIKKKNGRYDCTTEKTTDWDDKGNAKKWRQDLVDSINRLADQIGIEDERWEWKSFKDRGLEIKPTIHLGEKAAALERKGVHTDKGDYNREIRQLNSLIVKAVEITKVKVDKAVSEVKQKAATAVQTVRNEILDVIRAVAERNYNRLKLPVTLGEYIRLIPNRDTLHERAAMENFVHNMKWTSFEQMEKYWSEEVPRCAEYLKDSDAKWQRKCYLEKLLEAYESYEPYIKFNNERWKLKGFARIVYERKHIPELEYFDFYRQELKDMIEEPDGKIAPKKWKKELEQLEPKYTEAREKYSKSVYRLAGIEVLRHNRTALSQMLESERRQQQRAIEQSRTQEQMQTQTPKKKKDRGMSL